MSNKVIILSRPAVLECIIMKQAASIIKDIFHVLGEIVYVAEVAFSRDSLSRKMMRLDPEYREWEINQAMRRIERSGFIQKKQNDIHITKKGSARVDYYKLQELSFDPSGKRWDHKWRIIIFDIPERRRNARKIFRDKLKEWDCTKLQQSVFVTPHVCNKEIDELIDILVFRPYVHVITVPTLGDQLTAKFIKKYKLD